MKGQIVGPLQFGGMNLTAEGIYKHVAVGSEMCMGLPARLQSLTLPLFLPLSLSPSFSSELEWLLSEKGAVKTTLEEDPRKNRKVRDVLTIGVKQRHRDAEDSDDDSD